MTDTSTRMIEHGQAVVDRERDAAVARARRTLCLKGDEFCTDCGEPIGVARRMALPSATRCIGCQTDFEKGGRR